MYATLMKTPEERRHNRRLVAMAKVLQAAALPQQAFAKVQAYTVVYGRDSRKEGGETGQCLCTTTGTPSFDTVLRQLEDAIPASVT